MEKRQKKNRTAPAKEYKNNQEEKNVWNSLLYSTSNHPTFHIFNFYHLCVVCCTLYIYKTEYQTTHLCMDIRILNHTIVCHVLFLSQQTITLLSLKVNGLLFNCVVAFVSFYCWLLFFLLYFLFFNFVFSCCFMYLFFFYFAEWKQKRNITYGIHNEIDDLRSVERTTKENENVNRVIVTNWSRFSFFAE